MTTDAGSAEELRLLIQRVARRIRANRAGDLSDTQLGVLFRLDEADQSPGELAAAERVTPPSMNRTLNGLEAAGLVSRHPVDGDARRVRVTLTPTGRDRIRATRAARDEWFAHQLSLLSPAERAALEAVTPALRRLAGS